jgi:hypothetical protein
MNSVSLFLNECYGKVKGIVNIEYEIVNSWACKLKVSSYLSLRGVVRPSRRATRQSPHSGNTISGVRRLLHPDKSGFAMTNNFLLLSMSKVGGVLYTYREYNIPGHQYHNIQMPLACGGFG